MVENKLSQVTELVHEHVFRFLEKAKLNGILPYAIMYLTFVAYEGEDNNFYMDDRENLGYLKNKARSLGIINEDGIVPKSTQTALNNFLFDKNNKFIIENQNTPDGDIIKEAFSIINKTLENLADVKNSEYEKLSTCGAVHQQALHFLSKQDAYLEDEARYYLAILAIKGEFKDDILGVINNKDTVDKFNADANSLGLAKKGFVRGRTRDDLRSFFSDENECDMMPKEYIRELKKTFNEIESKILEKERQSSKRAL